MLRPMSVSAENGEIMQTRTTCRIASLNGAVVVTFLVGAFGCKPTPPPSEQNAAAPSELSAASLKAEKTARILKSFEPYRVAKDKVNKLDVPDCPGFQCGANTAVVDNSPVNPIDMGGNFFDLRFEVSKKFCDGVERPNLMVHHGTFVPGNGADACDKGKLVLKEQSGKRWIVRFDRKDSVALLSGSGRKPVAYRFKVKGSSDSTEKSICRNAESADKTGVPPHALRPGVKWADAFLVARDYYDTVNARIRKIDYRKVELFNIACAGTALAKMRLLGLDPEADPDDGKRREATLKMITARYCEGLENYAFTEEGIELKWDSSPAWPPSLKPHESYWTNKGALCLDHPRLFNDDPVKEKDLVKDIRDFCSRNPCTESNASGALWATSPVKHIDHPVPCSAADPC